MSTCFLKRALPFMLTLMLGILIANLTGHARPPRRNLNFIQFGHGCKSRAYTSQKYFSSSPPLINYKPQPLYTEKARRDGITGVVSLRALFGKDGTVSNIEVIKSLPDGLTEEAIKAARSIKFTPAMVGGEPTGMTQYVEYNFGYY